MRLPEQRLWDRMRAALRPRGVLLHRIENIVGEGMPDVVACCRGTVTFVELKAIEAPPVRATTPLLGEKRGLSAAQKNWHHDWNAAGGRTLILIGIGQEIAVIDGSDADLVNTMTATDMRRVSSIKDRIDALVLKHGSLRAVARCHEIEAGYLSRLRSGEKEEPGPRILRRLGLRPLANTWASLAELLGAR